MAKVLKAFVDKNTGEPYNEGYEYEADEARIQELVEAGYVSAPEAKNKAKQTPKRTTAKAKKDEVSITD